MRWSWAQRCTPSSSGEAALACWRARALLFGRCAACGIEGLSRPAAAGLGAHGRAGRRRRPLRRHTMCLRGGSANRAKVGVKFWRS